ncbi:T-cell immunomodulatory protein-like isoform X1 [Hydra vulgaris]|uniref:T-cell immunomodulatory protein-like isoform X1 n=1 Tax=Hydra vulgaris TaxID=6087 RepID=A0ABM4DP54_HYDVU
MHVTTWMLFVAFGIYGIDISFSIDEVFSIDGLIAAYGDFNSDQALDMFIISSDWTQLKVYVWNVVKQMFMELHSVDYKTNTHENEVIVSVSTADFNGDGCLDVLICLSTSQLKKDGFVNVTIYYGDTVSLISGHWSVRMLDQPSVIDVNGDLLPDLFGTNSKGVRSYWISVPADTISSGYFTEDSQFYTEISTTLVIPQSNAFVDVTGDQHADLVVKSYYNETKSIMVEIWTQDSGKKNLTLNDSSELGLKNASYVGQMSFVDYDGDSIIDLVLPVCLTKDCSHSVLYARTINFADPQSKWSVVIDNTFGDWQFPLHKMNGSDNIPLTLVIGDYLLDGMIDIVTILQFKENKKLFAANLINIPCSDSKSTGCEGKRTFSVQNTMNSISDPISISLMDVYENGVLDFLVTCRTGVDYVTKILRNEFVVDAAFLKVAVVGGICYTDCKCNKGSTNHGAHQVGAMTNIRTTNTDGHLMVIKAVQLAQSGYFSLQLPYIIFGLGKSPNFVDEIKIGIPKGDNQYVDRVHEWVAIIPNAQVIVIPYPKDSPSEWMTKLLVGKSKMFVQTGGVLLGTCLLIAGIIIILHVKEKKEDEKEKRKEAHKFHFDAL